MITNAILLAGLVTASFAGEASPVVVTCRESGVKLELTGLTFVRREDSRSGSNLSDAKAYDTSTKQWIELSTALPLDEKCAIDQSVTVEYFNDEDEAISLVFRQVILQKSASRVSGHSRHSITFTGFKPGDDQPYRLHQNAPKEASCKVKSI